MGVSLVGSWSGGGSVRLEGRGRAGGGGGVGEMQGTGPRRARQAVVETGSRAEGAGSCTAREGRGPTCVLEGAPQPQCGA